MPDDFEDYESGPFCIHWGDPADCEDLCLREGCGHKCHFHSCGGFECLAVDGCPCKALVYDYHGERKEVR